MNNTEFQNQIDLTIDSIGPQDYTVVVEQDVGGM